MDTHNIEESFEMIEDGRLLKELNTACEKGDTSKVRELMRHFPPSSNFFENSYRPPIFWACKAGQFDTVVTLIEEFGCDPHYISEKGHTLIHVACARGHVNVARYLARKHSVDPNKPNNHGTTPLLSACNNGHTQVVILLIDELKCNLHTLGEHGKSLLHIACRNGHIEIVRLLVEKYHLDPQAVDLLGETPLHIACSKGHLLIVKYLVDELRCPLEVYDRRSTTPLHNACRNGQVDIVQYLVDNHKCSLHMYDHSGYMPFHAACQYGRKDVLTLLLERGFNPNTPTLSLETPIEIVRDRESTTVLIQKGARTEGIKLDILHHFRIQQPLSSLVHVLVIGHEGSGKSTIVKALQTPPKLSHYISKFFGSCMVDGSHLKSNTTGIVPIRFDSPEFGNLMIFDFAGQYDYHPSHAAVLEHSNVSSAPLFLLVLNLTETLETNSKRVNYWINFVENNPIPGGKHPHAITIGSHRDELRKRCPRDYNAQITALEGITRSRFKCSKITLDGFIALDCREISSDKHTHLRKQLKHSCEKLRSNIELDACCHVLMVVLLKEFQAKISCTIEEVSKKVSQSEYPLSIHPERLCELAEALSSRTEILFIKHKHQPEKSWILLQLDVFLSQIHGRIFAPKNFPVSLEASEAGVVQWSQIRNCFSDIPDPNLVVAFLGQIEECKVIDDPAVLELIDKDLATDHRDGVAPNHYPHCPTLGPTPGRTPPDQPLTLISPPEGSFIGDVDVEADGTPSSTSTTNPPQSRALEVKSCPGTPHAAAFPQDAEPFKMPTSPKQFARKPRSPSLSGRRASIPEEKYLFIPGLISADYPSSGVWKGKEGYTFYSGWCLQCSEKKIFERRFLQALLLRLTFGFAVSQTTTKTPGHRPTTLTPSRRECTIWKNGLRWLSLDGIEVVVEFVEDDTAIRLLMRAKELSQMKCVKLRSAIIQKILETKHDYCANLDTSECLIHPRHIKESSQYPVISQPLCSLSRYDITAIAEAFITRSDYVYDTKREGHALIKDLVYFDSYNGVRSPVLCRLYDHDSHTKDLKADLLQDFAFCQMHNAPFFKEVLLSDCPHWYSKEIPSIQENGCLQVLLWYQGTDKKSVSDFRSDLDTHSLFAGRNILEVEWSTTPVELTGKHSIAGSLPGAGH